MGPSRTPSLSESGYFLSLVDDYSKKVWIFILKTKYQTFERFKEWKAKVENQTNKRVKYLARDNGLEFLGGFFNKSCVDHGIIRHRTTPYTLNKMEWLNT